MLIDKRFNFVISQHIYLSNPGTSSNTLPDFCIQHSQLSVNRSFYIQVVQAFANKLEGLPHVLLDPSAVFELSWEPGIKNAIAVGREGTCVLEQLDAAAAYYKRPPLPDSRKKRKPDAPERRWGAVVVTGALAVGGALLWRRHARRRDAR